QRLVEQVRRQQVDGSADRTNQRALLAARQVEALGEARADKLLADVEGPDHSALAEVSDPRVCAQRGEPQREHPRSATVFLQDVVALETIEHSQRRAARQRVAGVRMRVQK